jgi:hypothetical protein
VQIQRHAGQGIRLAPPGITRGLKSRRGRRRGARLVRDRQVRRLVCSLHFVAKRGAGVGIGRRELVLIGRAAAVRTELLQIAALLHQTRAADPEVVRELNVLVSHACDSPLYNEDVHISELYATVDHALRRLTASTGPVGFPLRPPE